MANNARYAARELARKLKLERSLTSRSNSLFSRIRKDSRVDYAQGGVVLDATQYETNWRDLIEEHHRRVMATYGFDALDGIPLTPATAELVRELFSGFSSGRKREAAALITASTQEDIASAFLAARSAIAGSALDATTNVAVAKLASASLQQTFAARGAVISMTETELAVERLKSTKARSLAGGNFINDGTDVPSVNAPQILKIWITVGDERVRLAHRVAGLAPAIPESQPFIVNGEPLKHPGDPSLGASLGNIINCRCTARYFVEGDE